jgi:hypothetical protein
MTPNPKHLAWSTRDQHPANRTTIGQQAHKPRPCNPRGGVAKTTATAGFLLAVSVLFFSFLGSAGAETLSPWFHVASVSRPGNLQSHPGLLPGQDEVQELVFEPGSFFELKVGGKPVGKVPGFVTQGFFEAEPYPGPGGGVGPPASAADIQLALEAVYGAHNVEVTGGVPPAAGTGTLESGSTEVKSVVTSSGGFAAGQQIAGKGIPAGTTIAAVEPGKLVLSAAAVESGEGVAFAAGPIRLMVKSVGEDANNAVARLEVGELVGLIKTSVVTEGKPPQVDGFVAVIATNVGDTDVDGSSSPVKIVDTLPEGLNALTAEANTKATFKDSYGPVVCKVKAARVVECTFAAKLPPYQQIELRVGVAVQGAAHSGEENEVSVSGGGAPPAHAQHPVVISGAPTPFGVEDYALAPEEVGGVPDTQAGSHPFQLTTSFSLKQVLEPNPVHAGEGEPSGLPKDLTFRLPAGLIGNPSSVAKCTLPQFNARTTGFAVTTNECPAGSIVGVASVSYTQEAAGGGMQVAAVPLFNLEPGVGEPARFGFQPAGVPIILDTSVRTGEDYGVTVHVSNISQTIGFLSNTVTFWGIPGDPRHDSLRGENCLAEIAEDLSTHAPCQPLGESHAPPLLSLPTSCTGSPLQTSVLAASWADPHSPLELGPEPQEQMPTLDGCGLLPFASQISVTPDLQAGSSPSGLKVDVHVPQEEALNAEGLAPADVKNTTVAFPEGLQLNPSAADGLDACSLAQIGYKGENPETHVQEFTPDEASCPDASKIAKVTFKLPILPVGQDVTGFVYIAAPQNFTGLPQNPFSSLVAVYLVAKDPISGILVKLPGRVSLSPTGQITTTLENTPQAPFEDAEFEFFGGERAPLATPARCGSYTTSATFEPWSNGGAIHEELHSASHFEVLTGPNGGPCPGASLPFAPSLASETTNINAGSFTPLVTTLSREDGQQAMQSVTLHYPPGVSGILSGIPLCPEAQANAGTCGEGSLIGETIVSVGVGGDPFTVTGGKVYLTEKYGGAPFGLSIVNPAKAGPFDLQEGRPVVVRATINIDPATAALTITTGAIPTVIEGFPLQIKHVNVNITRPAFTFNPTSCNPMQITGQVTGTEEATAPVAVPFQVTNCAALSFAPKLSATTSGHTSKAKGASLTVKLTYPKAPFGSQANIARVKVDLPKQLPSRLTTLQKACTATQFKANPAGCPAASIVGHAKAITPLLPVPLEGRAYFVSNGSEAFPNLIMVLEGYGITIDLVGDTFIKKGVTSSTFKTVPDQPVTSFELTLPEGKYSALAANQNLCTTKLTMPTELAAQNGPIIHRTTKITATGCKKPPKHKKKHRGTAHAGNNTRSSTPTA